MQVTHYFPLETDVEKMIMDERLPERPGGKNFLNFYTSVHKLVCEENVLVHNGSISPPL